MTLQPVGGMLNDSPPSAVVVARWPVHYKTTLSGTQARKLQRLAHRPENDNVWCTGPEETEMDSVGRRTRPGHSAHRLNSRRATSAEGFNGSSDKYRGQWRVPSRSRLCQVRTLARLKQASEYVGKGEATAAAPRLPRPPVLTRTRLRPVLSITRGKWAEMSPNEPSTRESRQELRKTLAGTMSKPGIRFCLKLHGRRSLPNQRASLYSPPTNPVRQQETAAEQEFGRDFSPGGGTGRRARFRT